MRVKAIRPDGTFIEFEIPEFAAPKYERDIEVNIPEGSFPRETTVRMWHRCARIKCVEV